MTHNFNQHPYFLASEIITRDCLSALKPYRTDIPADKYEGCRQGTFDPKLANYVNNSIKEINVKRDYFPSTTFCFCFLDHRCNSSSTISNSLVLLFAAPILVLLKFLARNWDNFLFAENFWYCEFESWKQQGFLMKRLKIMYRMEKVTSIKYLASGYNKKHIKCLQSLNSLGLRKSWEMR